MIIKGYFMKIIFFILVSIFCLKEIRADSETNFYADINDELINLPASVAMVGADISISSGTTFFSSPANLPFDSMHHLELAYANYFQNSFSTSLLSYNGVAPKGIGYSVTAGYIFVPDIEMWDTTQDGTSHLTGIRNCSIIYFRAGLGKRFNLGKSVVVSIGGSLQAKRTKLIGYRGYGLGMDAGTRILFSKTGISAAVLMENVTSSFTYWSKDYQQWAYPHIRVGLGWGKKIPYIYGSIRLSYTTPDLLANEGVNYYSEDEYYDLTLKKPEWLSVYKNPKLLILAARFGLEYEIMNRVTVRGGITKGKAGFGAGVNLFKERAAVNFAYVIHELAGTYQLGLSYQW